MQKVVGSSPIIRSQNPPQLAGFVIPGDRPPGERCLVGQFLASSARPTRNGPFLGPLPSVVQLIRGRRSGLRHSHTERLFGLFPAVEMDVDALCDADVTVP